jgi:hypothetical protein
MILPTIARADCPAHHLRVADLWAEADLLTAVMAGCGMYGWRRQHQLPALTSRGRHHTAYSGDGGWPDVVAVRDGVLLVVELKAERGSVTREQRAWLDLLAAVPGVLAGVWRPRDWQHGLALDVLDNPTRYLEAA